MDVVGRACLVLALLVALYGIGASIYGARTRRRDWVTSGRRAVYGVFALSAVAFGILEHAFLTSNFAFEVVASHSSTTTPWYYQAAAAWSSQEGSLLLWVLLLSAWSSLVLFVTRRRMRDVTPYATATLLVFAAFFASLLVFSASPFSVAANPVAEGSGLQPLLRNPGMLAHPVFLYSGYTLFTIPFAFAIGALIVRRVDAEWIAATRRFSLAAWLFLGIGILLGSRWSYAELGWGGYWAWDPVENASLLPWLTGTAFLHSVMIQERRGMLKVWNASLILATGILAILGTFLVRSGILDSIHAFGASTLGVPFVVFIAVLVLGSAYLVVSRQDALKAEHRLDSLLSREAVFLFNNLVLVALTFVILFLTFFPLIAEALTGTKRAIGPPVFDKFAVPLTLVLVLLSGIGPVIAWRKANAENVRRNFRVPIAVGVLALVLLAPFTYDKPLALLMFGAGAFVFGTIGQEFWRGIRARRAMTSESVPAALVSLVSRNRRRYGGYTIHAGMALLFVGVAASSAFQNATDERLDVGQSAEVSGYDVTYKEATGELVVRNGRLERLEFGAVLEVRKDGKFKGTLLPNKGYYPTNTPNAPIRAAFEGEATSEVALDAGLRKDFWTAVAPDLSVLDEEINNRDAVLVAAARKAGSALDPQRFAELRRVYFEELLRRYTENPPPATFRLIVSPMVTWIWLGAILTFLGGLIALWPAARGDRAVSRATAGYASRVARELGRA
ncbi:MAG: heme lyase CcmF/NrfE family subunit [Solirubrobacterales bacterium]|jgi:cytochrome c-type biogenesis protein CcmF|nr:heme lyase CcmF/NrfE family subunit [Solirubrobacterales bacterium]